MSCEPMSSELMSTKCQEELVAACRAGDMELARAALASGADLHHFDDDEQPLHVACRAGHQEVAHFLHRAGASLEGEGQTPLHCACSGGHLELANWLRAMGASISATNEDEWQPLMCAAVNGHLAVAQWLLAEGAEPNAMNSGGRTAADVARLRGFNALAVTLEQAALQVPRVPNRHIDHPKAPFAAPQAIAESAVRNASERQSSVQLTAEDDAPPAHYVCPLTGKLMQDPVCTLEGVLYERAAIEEWIRDKGSSPLTGAALPAPTLIPVPALRDEIQEWAKEHR